MDFGDLVRKLVLSERFVLESMGFTEFPLLIRKFGYDGVMEMLKSGLVEVQCEFAGVVFSHEGLPLGSHRIEVMSVEPTQHIERSLSKLYEIPGLTAKQTSALHSQVTQITVEPPSNVGLAMLAKLEADIESGSPILKTAVTHLLNGRVGRLTGVEDFSLTLIPAPHPGHAKDVVEVDQIRECRTDLGERYGFSREDIHEIVEGAITAVGCLNRRIELMEQLNAVTGFQTDELALFDEKLSFLARQLDPDVGEQRFARVVELADLPDVSPAADTHDVDLARLIDIVQRDEARAFRGWLRGIDDRSDAEVREEVGRLRDTVRAAVKSPAGKAVRLGVAAALSFVPGVGPFVGTAASAADSFIVDNLLTSPGQTAFVSHLYPSIFTEPQVV